MNRSAKKHNSRLFQIVLWAPRAGMKVMRRTGHVVFLVMVLVLYFVVPIRSGSSAVGIIGGLIATALCLIVVVTILVREAIFHRAEGRTRLGVVQLLLLIEVSTIMFALTYYAMSVFSTTEMVGIHTRIDALYFCMTTLATTGYGDIHAAGQLARLVVTLQLAFNVGFIALATRMVQSSFTAGRYGAHIGSPVRTRLNQRQLNDDGDTAAEPDIDVEPRVNLGSDAPGDGRQSE